jgi:hypothetical protein
MQLRYACEENGEKYVSPAGWRSATLSRCPLHPQGGCGFARHGSQDHFAFDKYRHR